MEQFKGTPGPWHLMNGGFTKDDVIPGLIQVYATNDDLEMICQVWEDKILKNKVQDFESNAYLIAAAPELLEACMKLAEWDKNHTAGRIYPAHEAKALEAKLTEVVIAARAAISKALNQEV